MSWNIQDSTGDGYNKFENKHFLSILKKCKIICPQETKKEVNIEGYKSFNSNPTNSRSGGVCILVENCLFAGVEYSPCVESEDIVAIKLKKNFFRFEFDLYLVCFYITPSTSSYAKKIPNYTEKTFSALSTVCNRLRQKGEVVMCGDANARTGTLPDFISSQNTGATHNIYYDIGFQHDVEEPRNNSDPTLIEPHCQNFLDLVINNQLKILNGRTLGDAMGNLTCHKRYGSSLVDYFVATSWVRDHVDSLQIKEFTSYSDHCPLILNLTTFEPLVTIMQLPEFTTVPCGYRWDNSKSPELFKSALNNPEVATRLENIVNSAFDNSPEENCKLNEALTNCIYTAADSVLKTKKLPQNRGHKKWFDPKCSLSKRNLNRLANRLGSDHCNPALRKEYFTQRNKHTRLINHKKYTFLKKSQCSY